MKLHLFTLLVVDCFVSFFVYVWLTCVCVCVCVCVSSWPPAVTAHVHCGMWRADSCCRVSMGTQLMSCPWTSPHLRLETLLSPGWERDNVCPCICFKTCAVVTHSAPWMRSFHEKLTPFKEIRSLQDSNNSYVSNVSVCLCMCVIRALIRRPTCGTCALDRTFNLSRATSPTSTV